MRVWFYCASITIPPEHRHDNAVPLFRATVDGTGLSPWCSGGDYCVVRKPHKVSGFEAPRDKVSRTQVVSRPQGLPRRGAPVARFSLSAAFR